MKEFFDTSVLVAAFWGGHQNHNACIERLAAARKRETACGLHSLAEVYATMTALPVNYLLPPEQVALFLQEMRDRLTVVSLSADEYFHTVRRCADQGLISGRIYDALLLACAAKAKAKAIYTLNLKHFRAIAPELADRIQSP